MFDRNTLVAFLLIAVILIFMPYYQDYMNPVSDNPVDSVLYNDTPANPAQQPAIVQQENINISNLATPPPTIFADTSYQTQKKSLVLENDFFYLTLSNEGGGTIRSFVFKNYFIHGKMVNLIPETDNANLAFSYMNVYNEEISFASYPFNSPLFEFYNHLDTIQVTQGMTIEFTLNSTNNRTVIRKFSFSPDKYEFDLEQELRGFQESMPGNGYNINWNSGFLITERNPKDDLQYSYIYAKVGDEIVDLTLKDKPQNLTMSGDVKWASVRSKYFSASLIPRTNDGKAIHLSGIKTHEMRDSDFALTMPYANAAVHNDRFTIVIAPLIDDYLESFDIQLEKIMNWGWKLIQPISFAVLFLLKFLHGFIPNYGLVLILFSIIIKLILYPLTHKSYESMKKMQEIQPL
ncbi:MAG: membrane protein insertase YidC, partial [Candidatus Marinimicrobia bacterium]|nr:membrane protein insertase YidC [Candidatus Neomarinimicrobiota bacterium]